jgi:hypothetical protein
MDGGVRMALDQPQAATSARLANTLKIVTAVTVALVVVQAILAGRGLFISHDYIDIHGVVADVIFLIVVAQALMTYVAVRRGLAGRTLAWINLALVLLVVVQIGLGYSGRDSGNSAALHVPNGVLIFGLSIVAHMQARGRVA